MSSHGLEPPQAIPPYVPDCRIELCDDGTFRVTHPTSGRVRTVTTARHALIVGTGLAIAAAWKAAS